MTLDFSYIALDQFDPSFKWGGHIVNLGVTVPTNVGVLSTVSADSPPRASRAPGLDWGTLAGLNVSFSKDLFPDFYVGAGLGFEAGLATIGAWDSTSVSSACSGTWDS